MNDNLKKKRDLPEIEIHSGKRFAQTYLGMCTQIEDPQYKGVYFIPVKRENETYKFIYLKDFARYPENNNKLRYHLEFVDEHFNVVNTIVKLSASRFRDYLGIKESLEEKRKRLCGLK